MKRALIIVNPIAGNKRPREIGAEAREFLRARGWDTSLVETRAPEHATELAMERGRELDRVVAVGGDGTLREAVAGLDGEGPPLGVIPTGNANVVARELGIPQGVSAAIRLQAAAVPRAIDVGTVGETIFLAMASVGYDGIVTEGVRRIRATRLGRVLYRRGASSLLYGLVGIRALVRLRPARLTVGVDGRESDRTYASVVIANSETYALGWSMTPGADPSDGVLDHQLNRHSAPWFVLCTVFAAMAHRRVPGLLARYGSGRRYEIVGSRPFPWQVDGDSMPRQSRLQVGIRPRYARILVPEDSAS